MEIENGDEKICYYFSNALHARIKSAIFAHVWCRIENDQLTVEIVPKFRNTYTNDRIKVIYRQSDMMNLISNGTTADDIAKEVIKKYRRSINRIFFKQGNYGGENYVTEEFIKECDEFIDFYNQEE